MSDAKWLPDVHFGETNAPLPEPESTTGKDDDEQLATTPLDVVAMLGFDPLELDQEEDA